MPTPKVWFVQSGSLSPVSLKFLFLGNTNKTTTLLNIENVLMQLGDTHWSQAIISPATEDQVAELLGTDLHARVLKPM